MLSIKEFTVSEPDSDGDMRAEASFAYRNESSEEEELVISGLHLLTEQGLVVTSSTDEHEEPVTPGSTIELHASSNYFKKTSSVQSHKLLLDIVSCRCFYKDLGTFDVPTNSITGSVNIVELGEGFLLQGLSISTGSPDDDGDVTLEIKALIRNTSNSYTPKIRLEGRVKGQNGRELEECSTYGEVMMPNETRVLSASTYLKKNRINGAQVDLRLCLFVASTRTRKLS